MRADNFLRAFIDKRTGSVRYQVYQMVNDGLMARQFQSVNYSTPNGPVSANIEVIGHQVLPCAYGSCSFQDDLVFDINEDVLRTIAGTYSQGKSPLWRFKLIAQSGFKWEDRMPPAEIAGLLAAVEVYKASHSR